MQINYYVKHVYGVPRMYIEDESMAKTIAGLVKMRTLDPEDKERLEVLGVEFHQVLAPLE